MEEKLIEIRDAVYKLCLALVAIVDRECCTYGFDDEVEMAERFIEEYEKENNS